MSVAGKAPGLMLQGVVTGRIPAQWARQDGVSRTGAAYSTVLTPKGRIVSDLALIRLPDEAEAFWMDVPTRGVEGLVAYLRKVLPPRMARLAEVEGYDRLALVGPAAARILSAVSGLPQAPIAELSESEALFQTAADGSVGLAVFRPADLGTTGYELVIGQSGSAAMQDALLGAGAVPAGLSVWETLRVEAARPSFGVDMDETTIPTEAGIDGRAIDHTKGCYTGQEVIVRIRDRGHVNRHLRQLLLGESPSPAAGTELFSFDSERPVGHVTSAVNSPRFGQTVALGYVRREVEPGQAVRVGGQQGPEALLAPTG